MTEPILNSDPTEGTDTEIVVNTKTYTNNHNSKKKSIISDSDDEDIAVKSETDLNELGNEYCLRNVYTSKHGYEWVDILVRTKQDGFKDFLNSLTTDYDVKKSLIRPALIPNLLPRIEFREDNRMLIVTRYADIKAKISADSIGEITNKIMIFVDAKRIITVHREEINFINSMRKRWDDDFHGKTRDHVLNTLLNKIIATYTIMVDDNNEQMELYEKQLLNNHHDIVEDLYKIKRKASIYKKMLKLTCDLINKYHKMNPEDNAFSQELLDYAEAALFNADELHENAMNMMNLFVTIASHKTNQLMTVLTVFSAYFIPLTFLAGIYGMNFEYMPELEWHGSYPLLAGIMVFISIIITILFMRKGIIPNPLKRLDSDIKEAINKLKQKKAKKD